MKRIGKALTIAIIQMTKIIPMDRLIVSSSLALNEIHDDNVALNSKHDQRQNCRITHSGK